MSSQKNFSDQAVVLKRYNFSEADRIVTLFTQSRGKITAIAKGVRKSTSRKAAHIEPFTHANIYFAHTRGMPIISQAETVNNFSHLRNNLDSTRLTFHVIEIIDKLFPDDQPQPQVFKQLLLLLNFLNNDNLLTQTTQQQAISQFQLNILSGLGFGTPSKTDYESINGFIEHILDRRLTAKEHLS